MTSMAKTTSFLGSAVSLSKLPSTPTSRRSMAMPAKASATKAEIKGDNATMERSSKRRDLVFAAAAAAVCLVARVGMADEAEPKPGTPEAKKKYSPICITMPTARICRN